jgi:hypothetical protein
MGGRQSKVVVVSLAGGVLRFTTGLVDELEVTTSRWSSVSGLSEVLSLAKMGKIRVRAKKIGFGDMNRSF